MGPVVEADLKLLMDGGVAIDTALQDYENAWLAHGTFSADDIEEITSKSDELLLVTKAGTKLVAALSVLLKL